MNNFMLISGKFSLIFLVDTIFQTCLASNCISSCCVRYYFRAAGLLLGEAEEIAVCPARAIAGIVGP